MNGLMLMAEDTSVATINSAISSMCDNVKSIILTSLPVVLSICGIIVGVTAGVRFFKRFAK